MRPLDRSWPALVRDLFRDTWEMVYPPVCVRCHASLESPRGNGNGLSAAERWFCSECYQLLRCRITNACRTCGAPVGPHLEAGGCPHCRGDRFAFDGVVALGVYEGELQRCCTQIKEPIQGPLAAGLTELLWEAHASTLTGWAIDLLVSVPHHWIERTTRPHLPPQTMATVLSRRLSRPMATHILAKRRRTPVQASLTPTRRRRNLKGAFTVTGRAELDGQTVLVADDILTTGTTAHRVAGVLKEAGARRVLVAVLARGLGQSATF